MKKCAIRIASVHYGGSITRTVNLETKRSLSHGNYCIVFIYKYFTSGLFRVLSFVRANCSLSFFLAWCNCIFIFLSLRSLNSTDSTFLVHASSSCPKVILYDTVFFFFFSFCYSLALYASQFIIFLNGFRFWLVCLACRVI